MDSPPDLQIEASQEDEQTPSVSPAIQDSARPSSDRASLSQFLKSSLPSWNLWRALGGCLVAFVCVVLIYSVIGGVAVYRGLKERAALTLQDAQVHHERGLAHVQNGEYELAIAEFEHTLRLDPAHREARDALREARATSLTQPTPTSATLNEALNGILAEAEALAQEQRWSECAQRLGQLRDLDSEFQAQRVADLSYRAHLNSGLQLRHEGQVEAGLHAFERALVERPGDLEASLQLDLASLYVSAQATWGADWPATINFLDQLHTLTPDYLDVQTLLYQAYESYGDALGDELAWCLAEPQYMQAALLEPAAAIHAKQEEARELCLAAQAEPTVAPAPSTAPTPTVTATAMVTAPVTSTTTVSVPITAGPASVFFSRYNIERAQWEIVTVGADGGAPIHIVGDAMQPAVSPNGRLIAYHSETSDTEGLHVYNLATGTDTRITTFGEDVTPDWGPDNLGLVFASQRSGDRRWQVYLGWADAKGEAVPLVEGRTPAWSPDGVHIAYQGADEQGNNPGLYLISVAGGPATRLTDGESDRAPAWSPACTEEALCQIAFMSSRSGSWQIYVTDTVGGTPHQLTQAAGNAGLPAWSSDGRQMAFVSDQDGSWGVYVMAATGGQATRIADWEGNREDWLLEHLAWRP